MVSGDGQGWYKMAVADVTTAAISSHARADTEKLPCSCYFQGVVFQCEILTDRSRSE